MKNTIEPVWMTIKDASAWSGLSVSIIGNLWRGGHIKSSNPKMPGKSRGRRLINVQSLGDFIEAWVDSPRAQIVPNESDE